MANITAQMVKELREMTSAGMLDCKKALTATDGNMEEAVTWLREKGIAKAVKKEGAVAAEGLCSYTIAGNKCVLFELNSQTDFVAQNAKFIALLETVGNILVNSNATNTEEALKVVSDGKDLNTIILEASGVIGEKISFRRFTLLEKSDDQNFGEYIHMGGKISVLTLLDGANEEVAKDVSMHAAAMRPEYVKKEQVPEEQVEHEKKILTEQAIAEGKPANIAEKMVMGRINKFYKEICLEEQEFVKDNSVSVAKYVSNNGGQIVDVIRYEVGEGLEKRQENFAEEVAAQMNGE